MADKEFVEIDLAQDVKDFISSNADVEIDVSLKKIIFDSEQFDMLKVKKKIGSKTKILDVQKMTIDTLASDLE